MTANESPSSEPIPPHHELAQTPEPPTHVLFFCETPAATGGETVLTDSRVVAEHVRDAHPELFAALVEHGVRYVRVLPEEDDASSALGRSWKSSFAAETREAAEAAMAAQGTEVEWLPDGSARTTTRVLPAVTTEGGRPVFFNQVLAAVTGWRDSRNDPSRAVLLGDGSLADAAVLSAVAAWAREHASAAVPWAAGDVMVVDNRVAMHSRAPFEGPRRVLAAIRRGVFPSPARAAALDAALPRVALPAPAGAAPGDVLMPALGLGCWKIERSETAETVCAAIRCGWRHLDCAADYGNEAEVGEGIRLATERGFISGRGDLFLTSKLWNNFHRAEHVGPALSRTLADLGTDYLDLYLIHFPIPLEYVDPADRYPPGWVHDPAAAEPRMAVARVPLSETWGAMEEECLAGRCRRVGLSNHSVQAIRDLLSYCRVPPAVLQVELHPFLQQQKLLRFCAGAGIVVTGFSPLGAGSYVSLGMARAGDSVLRDEGVARVAAKHGVTPAQAVLRWGLRRGTTLVPKTTKLHRMVENLDVCGFELDEEDAAVLGALEQGRRFNDPGVFCELAFGTFCPIYE